MKTSNVPIFTSFSAKEKPLLKRIVVERRFAKNQTILYEEDTPKYMYIVYSGKVKVVQMSQDGKEHILAIHKSGDFFGEMALLDGKTSPATVIAMEDSEIGLITKNNFEKYLLKDEKMLKELISMLCLRLRDAWLMLKVLSFADAEKRVRAVLKHISSQHGLKDDRGIIIAMKLTHKDIADYASVSRETVTRFMDKFAKDGEIELLENKRLLLKTPFAEKMLSV
jgi:CRP/FNR family transcriptional regulator